MAFFVENSMGLALSYIVALVSPGPSLILVLQNSFISTKKYDGVWTALGTVAGISLQSLYVLMGLSILHSSPRVLKTIQIMGGCFLIYLGIKSLVKLFYKHKENNQLTKTKVSFHPFEAFKQGLYVDILNPLALTFFLTIFSLFIPQEASLNYRIFCWFEVIVLGAIWYIGISYISSFNVVRVYMEKLFGRNFSFFASFLLVFFGLKILFY